MTIPSYPDLIRVEVATTGTGSVTPGAAVNAGYFDFSTGGVSNGDFLTYVLEQLVDGVAVRQRCTGTYTSGTNTLTRTDRGTATDGDTLSLDGTAVLYVTAMGTELAFATAAAWRANTPDKILRTSETWSAADYVTLTDGATITPDFSTGFQFTVTLGGNRTLANPTNTKVGTHGVIEIIQDGTGSRTMTFSSNWKFVGGTDPTLTTTAAAKDYLFYHVRSSSLIVASLLNDVK